MGDPKRWVPSKAQWLLLGITGALLAIGWLFWATVSALGLCATLWLDLYLIVTGKLLWPWSKLPAPKDPGHGDAS
jgi:hypothetical protein